MKYKVGDEVLIKGEVTEVDNGVNYPYRIAIKDDDIGCNEWISEQILVPVTAKVKVPKWFDEWYHENDGNDKNDVECIRILSVSDKLYWLNGNEINQSLENKDRTKFIQAIINGYEVEEEKLYNVKVPHLSRTYYRKSDYTKNKLASSDEILNSDSDQQFTQAEIEKYGLEDCEKTEVEQVPEAYKQDAVEVEADENN